jgi:hypothetical protein
MYIKFLPFRDVLPDPPALLGAALAVLPAPTRSADLYKGEFYFSVLLFAGPRRVIRSNLS